jgi:hypothetical protein
MAMLTKIVTDVYQLDARDLMALKGLIGPETDVAP